MKINITKSYIEIPNDDIRGKPGFVIGAGHSLSGINISSIFDHSVFSVNSSIILMPWSSGSSRKRFWVSNDSLCMKWSYWDKVVSSNCNKIVRTSWLKYLNKLDDFYFFHPRRTSEGVIEDDDSGLAYCSSVPTSLDMAIKMGVNPILLLGVDHNFSKNHNGTHFWHNLPKKEMPTAKSGGPPPKTSQYKVFLYNNLAYRALSKFAESRGVKVINCNPASSVNEFEKINFKDYDKHI
jgi:hypothetical protein|tara:strand:+ start:7416 stop:8126 length:711 start_codon:yes stop_codon:yes gene_type:complete